MATILSHIALPITLKLISGKSVSKELLALGCLVSILPDVDVIAFALGIPYASEFGHRGLTHSIAFAFIVAFSGMFLSHAMKSTKKILFILLFLSTVSHSLLDALTNGGLGVALFWPVSNERIFFPWTPLDVSPIGITNFIDQGGIAVLYSELIWIWIPALICVVLSLSGEQIKKLKSGQ